MGMVCLICAMLWVLVLRLVALAFRRASPAHTCCWWLVGWLVVEMLREWKSWDGGPGPLCVTNPDRDSLFLHNPAAYETVVRSIDAEGVCGPFPVAVVKGVGGLTC